MDIPNGMSTEDNTPPEGVLLHQRIDQERVMDQAHVEANERMVRLEMLKRQVEPMRERIRKGE